MGWTNFIPSGAQKQLILARFPLGMESGFTISKKVAMNRLNGWKSRLHHPNKTPQCLRHLKKSMFQATELNMDLRSMVTPEVMLLSTISRPNPTLQPTPGSVLGRFAGSIRGGRG